MSLKQTNIPTKEEIQKLIGDPLGLELSEAFLMGFQSGWFNLNKKISEMLVNKRIVAEGRYATGEAYACQEVIDAILKLSHEAEAQK
jgi:hypothetical protein